MPELLLEVGCEELPASFVEKAFRESLANVTSGLREAGLFDGDGRALGTPRRLIVHFQSVLGRQPDVEKETRGPSLKASYGPDGAPTPALIGFCRGQGVAVESVRKDDQYVWATKRVVGRPAVEVLAEILPKAIRGLQFEKSMRWGSSRMRFARPIRWILASVDGVVPAFEIEGVAAGLSSRGHRFYSPESFEATTFTTLIEGLRSRNVEPDPEVRRSRIVAESHAVVEGKTPILSPELADENVFLTEWPTPIAGEFRSDYLELPRAVLEMAMAKHEKMFPVCDSKGNLTNQFVFVRNSGEDASVRKGCEWVLNARFNDAKFFFDEDRKATMIDFLDRTTGIVFQQKLGTVRQRAERLESLVGAILDAAGADAAEVESGRWAGRWCKADLSSGLVGELPALQGVIGGEYARRDGAPEAVCHAIATHYDLAKAKSSRLAIAVLVADQLDRLVGYLGLGLAPSGSSDPYALRRAATLVVESAWAWPGDAPALSDLIVIAAQSYADQGVELVDVTPAFEEVMAGRYAPLMPDVRHDVLEAALMRETAGAALDPIAVRSRVERLNLLKDDEAFVQTATRPTNILAAAKKKGFAFGDDDPLGQIEVTHIDSVEGLDLLTALREGEANLLRATDANEVVMKLRDLAGPINRFFDNTMIMAENVDVRFARLTLVNATTRQLALAGDFTKLVFAG